MLVFPGSNPAKMVEDESLFLGPTWISRGKQSVLSFQGLLVNLSLEPKELILAAINHWYGSEQRFTDYVRGPLREAGESQVGWCHGGPPCIVSGVWGSCKRVRKGLTFGWVFFVWCVWSCFAKTESNPLHIERGVLHDFRGGAPKNTNQMPPPNRKLY